VGGGVRATGWGPGGDWLVTQSAAMVGADDDVSTFDPSAHPVVHRLARTFPRLRIARTRRVLDALVPTVLEQKVIGSAARRSFAALFRRLGEPAPGPAGDAGMLVPPPPEQLARLPYYAFHRLGVERKRADTVRRAAAHAVRLEEAVGLGADILGRRLRAVPGIGPWTEAEVRAVAMGDPDAVSVGDFHIPNQVAWALAGEPRGDDNRMLELLAPFAGHRGRVIRLIEAAGITAPRFGPRLPHRSIAWH
jgi:3-methyladenine DNA glycosylase/8-oxoguanine DNA glycosylase